MKKITIGIPAYNEEANIGLLLSDILRQKNLNKMVEEVIVISDGCTDSTTQKVLKMHNKHIRSVVQKKRKGLAKTLNHIFSLAQTEVLIVLNADARIRDMHFLSKLAKPVLDGKADLTSTKLVEVPSQNFFDNILSTGMIMKSQIVQSLKNGKNVLTCYGVARAFSKKLYTSIRVPVSVGEDAYSYFYAVTNGYRYSFVKNTEVFYKPSNNYSDHKKQTLRFFKSQEIMMGIFGENFVRNSYYIPTHIVLKALLTSISQKPLYTLLYIVTVIISKIADKFSHMQELDYWDVSKSSKEVHSL